MTLFVVDITTITFVSTYRTSSNACHAACYRSSDQNFDLLPQGVRRRRWSPVCGLTWHMHFVYNQCKANSYQILKMWYEYWMCMLYSCFPMKHKHNKMYAGSTNLNASLKTIGNEFKCRTHNVSHHWNNEIFLLLGYSQLTIDPSWCMNHHPPHLPHHHHHHHHPKIHLSCLIPFKPFKQTSSTKRGTLWRSHSSPSRKLSAPPQATRCSKPRCHLIFTATWNRRIPWQSMKYMVYLPTFGWPSMYIPRPSMGRLYIYLHEWLIFYGFHVGKYTIDPWMVWDIVTGLDAYIYIVIQSPWLVIKIWLWYSMKKLIASWRNLYIRILQSLNFDWVGFHPPRYSK